MGLTCFTHILLCTVVASSACSQMAPSPPKKKTSAKKGDKRLKMDSKLFRSVHHFERYRDNFLSAGIIQERFVDLEDLRQTFIPGCFEGRGWEKLLSDFPVICEPLIREFYSNAVIKENELSCWVRGKEFILDAHVIDDALGLEGLDDEEFINYKDRSVSIETIQQRLGGKREGICLNTTTFPVDMRCLTIIMMFNLYPIKKLTTINCARAIFLMDLKEKNFIDISSHIYDIIVDETRTTSRPKLIFPSLLMRIFRRKGVPIPQDISPMSTPSAINRLTCKRISVRLPEEEDEGDEGEGVPMETAAEAAGHASTSTPRRSGKRPRASTSSDIPPDAFQIILERLDGIREVQTEHSERMKAMQDQIDVLSATLDSFTTQPDH